MISSLVTSDPVRLPPVATTVTNCRPSAPMYVMGVASIDDGSLISHSASPVAVANAHPDVVAVADETTASNDEDGVALVLERLS